MVELDPRDESQVEQRTLAVGDGEVRDVHGGALQALPGQEWRADHHGADRERVRDARPRVCRVVWRSGQEARHVDPLGHVSPSELLFTMSVITDKLLLGWGAQVLRECSREHHLVV